MDNHNPQDVYEDFNEKRDAVADEKPNNVSSVIYVDADKVSNLSRLFGSSKDYIRVAVHSDGVWYDALFTEAAIDTAILRADHNPEDVLHDDTPFFKRMWNWLFGN